MLIGRESERRIIEPLLAGARVGESAVLVLTGEAGIGKTALLDWAAAGATGMRVLRATGIEAEREVSFGGLLQLLRPVLDLLDALPGPQADAMAGALALRTGGAGDRFAVGAGTLSLICRAAEQRPLAILLDDAHLLDRPSVEALAFAARRLLADAVLLLATVRSGEPCALIDAQLPSIDISGLDLGAATALLSEQSSHPPPIGLVDRLFHATGGNPLALLELSADLDALLRLPPDAPVPVPATVALAVARETNRLDANARTALLIAAACGGELSLVIRALAQLSIDGTALEPAERAGLLRIVGDRVLFRHPLVRSSAYGAADPGERRAAHRALAAALPETDLERRAWHVAEATSGADEEAAGLLEAVAIMAAQRSADAVATTAFERSARLSPDDGAGIGRLIRAGESAWLAGQVGRSEALLGEAMGRASTAQQRVRAQELLGAIAARSGSLIDARDALSAAADQAADFDRELAVVLLADAINACFYLGDSGWAMTAIDRISRLLADGPTVRARIFGWMAVGTAELLAGRGGMEAVRRSVELATSTDELTGDPRRSTFLVLGPLLLRESGTGRELVQRAVEESRSRAAMGTLPGLLFHLARDDATTDRWPTAASEYHEAIRLARETGQTTDLAASLAGLGWLEARQGERVGCVAHLTESARLCDKHQIHLFRAWAFGGLGDLELGSGAVDAALRHFDMMAEFLRETGILDVDLAPDPERVELLARSGRADEAMALAHDYRDRAVAKGQPWALARAERSLALCCPEKEMDARFAAALHWHAATLDEFERAKTLLSQGSRMRRGRRRAEARAPLGQALAIFDSLGAAPFAALAAVELTATGERVRPKGASLGSELTPQEFQIASMLAAGRSTRQTAAALFLSPKTVEYHLRHVYTKLAIHSREELAHKLFR